VDHLTLHINASVNDHIRYHADRLEHDHAKLIEVHEKKPLEATELLQGTPIGGFFRVFRSPSLVFRDPNPLAIRPTVSIT
jgi:hypothetical protein